MNITAQYIPHGHYLKNEKYKGMFCELGPASYWGTIEVSKIRDELQDLPPLRDENYVRQSKNLSVSVSAEVNQLAFQPQKNTRSLGLFILK